MGWEEVEVVMVSSTSSIVSLRDTLPQVERGFQVNVRRSEAPYLVAQ